MLTTFYGLGRLVCAIPLRTVWRLRVFGRENVPRTGPLIVASNHVSYFDPPAVGVALPRPLYYMAKAELFTIPVLGRLITAMNSFPVDRSRGDVSAIRRSVGVLRSGAAMAIFPEGTRNRDGTRRAQGGVALLAALSGAPVLPTYVGGTENVKKLRQIYVVFGKPMQFTRDRKAGREELTKWTDQIMERIYAQREQLGEH